jgi:hypothetical protein
MMEPPATMAKAVRAERSTSRALFTSHNFTLDFVFVKGKVKCLNVARR